MGAGPGAWLLLPEPAAPVPARPDKVLKASRAGAVRLLPLLAGGSVPGTPFREFLFHTPKSVSHQDHAKRTRGGVVWAAGTASNKSSVWNVNSDGGLQWGRGPGTWSQGLHGAGLPDRADTHVNSTRQRWNPHPPCPSVHSCAHHLWHRTDLTGLEPRPSLQGHTQSVCWGGDLEPTLRGAPPPPSAWLRRDHPSPAECPAPGQPLESCRTAGAFAHGGIRGGKLTGARARV